ncbi:hypothetical protein [Shinella sp.]|uniref:hypothetical protein n=1 Tax=Shinella sp. TaxID=1870904 RepID=UPI0039E2AD88
MGDLDIAGIEILPHRHQRTGGDIGLDMEAAEAIEAELGAGLRRWTPACCR